MTSELPGGSWRRSHALCFLLAHPRVATARVHYLLVMSHMRSRSSVLCHVLGSNHGISGYGESHGSYRRRIDPMRLRRNLYREFGNQIAGTYLLDKLLHDYCRVTDRMLAEMRPKVLFLVREPRATLTSLIALSKAAELHWSDPESAAAYYCERLASLSALRDRIRPEDRLVLDAEDLVERTDASLTRLSEWLSLEEPLRPTYETFARTGEIGHGDPSDNIQRGSIAQASPAAERVLPPDLLAACREAYARFRDARLST